MKGNINQDKDKKSQYYIPQKASFISSNYKTEINTNCPSPNSQVTNPYGFNNY